MIPDISDITLARQFRFRSRVDLRRAPPATEVVVVAGRAYKAIGKWIRQIDNEVDPIPFVQFVLRFVLDNFLVNENVQQIACAAEKCKCKGTNSRPPQQPQATNLTEPPTQV